MEIIVESNKQQLGVRAAERGAGLIRDAIAARGQANIIVATGASQFEMLTELIKAEGIDWSKVTAFHLDEYVGLPLTHPASFRLYLWQRFVSQLPLPLRAFHYLDGESDAAAECRRVGDILDKHPIDVAFIGIGENGHVAFNDPPADFNAKDPYLVVNLDERCRQQQTGEGWFKTPADVPAQAISMSIPQILKSAALIISVPDERKAQAVADTMKQPLDPNYPSTCLRDHPSAYLYLDQGSASLLDNAK